MIKYLENRAHNVDGNKIALTSDELDKALELGKAFGFYDPKKDIPEEDVLFQFVNECTELKVGYLIFQGVMEGKIISIFDEQTGEFVYTDNPDNEELLENSEWADIIE